MSCLLCRGLDNRKQASVLVYFVETTIIKRHANTLINFKEEIIYHSCKLHLAKDLRCHTERLNFLQVNSLLSHQTMSSKKSDYPMSELEGLAAADSKSKV